MKTKKQKGFTIIELLVVITLFTSVMLITSSLYTRYSTAERKLRTENTLYEETRFALERIVKEFRGGTIDYEEYWNQANAGSECILYSSGSLLYQESFGQYAQCYKDYANQFYNIKGINIGQNPINATDENEQESRNAVSRTGSENYNQSELYVINNSGNQKTLLRCNNCDTDPTNSPGKLQILTLNGYDYGYEEEGNAVNNATKNDGIIDTWVCEKDYTCSNDLSDGTAENGRKISNNEDGWTDYSPSSLDITDLKFYIAPLEDPYKAYNEDSSKVQMQPHITIMITAQTTKEKLKGILGDPPALTLQTSVSGRVFNEVE